MVTERIPYTDTSKEREHWTDGVVVDIFALAVLFGILLAILGIIN
jgi:hypothetical protein